MLGRMIKPNSGINQDEACGVRSLCKRQELLRREGLRGRRQQNLKTALKKSAFEQCGQRTTPFRENDRGTMAVACESFGGGYGSLRKGLRARFTIRRAWRRFRLVFAEHGCTHRGV